MNAIILIAIVIAFNMGCSGSSPPRVDEAAPSLAATPSSEEIDRLEAFFEEVFQRKIERLPQLASYLGIKQNYDTWDDISDRFAREDHELAKRDLARLRDFDLSKLDSEAILSYRLFEYETEMEIAAFPWRFHNYPINQMYGLHTWVPAFLSNFHRVDEVSDAEAYIGRLNRVRPLFVQLEENLAVRQERGILPPKFVFPYVVEASRNVLRGAPFEASDTDSYLLADFRRKLERLDVAAATKAELAARAEQALLVSVKPAYESLVAFLERQAAVATSAEGAWKLPNGDDYYAFALRKTTTTEMSADEIHDIGRTEVERIHGGMRTIMEQVGFGGTLAEFFAQIREDQRFYYPNDEGGRKAYLDRAREIIDAMEARLDTIFPATARPPLLVKPVERFRENSAGKAFYNAAAPDGSRPGIYYANLQDMRDMPIYQMEALAYHEAIPGHHMQVSIAQALEDLPKFRRFGRYTAYREGWGLYAEYLPKEMGFYQDAYSDFGRLAMELWRACRLVVDTGLHHERWTREQSIEYLSQNTPNPRGDIVKAVERYIVIPSQATSYTIGMLKILALRERARRELGAAFDIREYHDVVLGSGPVPLTMLAELVAEWVASKPTGQARYRRPVAHSLSTPAVSVRPRKELETDVRFQHGAE